MRQIPSAPEYFVTEDGRIFRLISSVPDKDGYLRATIRINGTLKRIGISRAVAEAYHGPAPSPEHVARHLNGTVTDNRPKNIAWGTQKENKADEILHGTRLLGEKLPWAKLKEADVVEVKNLIASGLGVVDISKRTGISVSSIAGIRGNRTWAHIPWPNGFISIPAKWRRLTPENIAEIRALLDRGGMQKKQIAKRFGVSDAIIRDIEKGRRYKTPPA